MHPPGGRVSTSFSRNRNSKDSLDPRLRGDNLLLLQFIDDNEFDSQPIRFTMNLFQYESLLLDHHVERIISKGWSKLN